MNLGEAQCPAQDYARRTPIGGLITQLDQRTLSAAVELRSGASSLLCDLQGNIRFAGRTQ